MSFNEISLILSGGKAYTIIDLEDYEKIIHRRWSIGNKGYAVSYSGSAKRGHTSLQRMIMGTSGNMIVDHINGNRLDNRKSNLRICTYAQNVRNRRPHSGRKYKGVYLVKGKYLARIMFNGKSYRLGLFLSDAAAAEAYNLAAKRLHGDFARLNIIY